MKLKLVSEIPPSVNHYLGHRAFGKNISVYKKTEAKKYQKTFAEYVSQEIQKQHWELPVNATQHFYVDMWFYFPRIDMDAPNYDKCLLDAITDSGLIWVDDNVVCSRVNRILYDVENPRVEIEIYPVEYIGIFDNKTEYDKFVNKCMACRRYLDGRCSILRHATEGRIQSSISNSICSEFKEKKVNKRSKNK